MNTYLLALYGNNTKKISVSFSMFPDHDTHCVIEEATDIAKARVLVVHSLYPNQNEQLFRLQLLLDLLQDLGAENVSVFCPYLPYSRQDKRHLSGEALAAKTVCKMLASMRCSRLFTIDCHFMRDKHHLTFGKLPITNINASEILINICKTKYLSGQQYIVIGPDQGASLLTEHVGYRHMRKVRGDYKKNDNVHERTIISLDSDHLVLSEPIVVCVDDMISTGSTMIKAVENILDCGATKIYCVATHGLFLDDSYEILSSLADGLIVGDTIAHKDAVPIISDILEKQIIPIWQKSP